MEHIKRKSTRIPDYDYSTPNYYFITICTHEKRCIFGKPNALNRYGEYARDNLLKLAELNVNMKIDKFVVMPNHIHAILIVEESAIKGNDISVAIGQYKMSVTKQIRKEKPDMKIWQRSFHDHIIRNQKGYEKIWEYIHNNPIKWEEDCFYTDEE